MGGGGRTSGRYAGPSRERGSGRITFVEELDGVLFYRTEHSPSQSFNAARFGREAEARAFLAERQPPALPAHAPGPVAPAPPPAPGAGVGVGVGERGRATGGGRGYLTRGITVTPGGERGPALGGRRGDLTRGINEQSLQATVEAILDTNRAANWMLTHTLTGVGRASSIAEIATSGLRTKGDCWRQRPGYGSDKAFVTWETVLANMIETN